ncbi:MAG: shikimate dehydrogenase, partial [Pseudomonadota bacterium]
AQQLADQFAFHGPIAACSFSALSTSFDLVINATSASLNADVPPIPACVFGPDSLAYDIMYGAQATVFMQFAVQHGAQTCDGLGMLVEQAAAAFYLWRGVRPETSTVLADLRGAL